MNNIIYYKDIYNSIINLLSPIDILNLAKVSREFENKMMTNKDYLDFLFIYNKYSRIHIVDICNHNFVNLLKYFDNKEFEYIIDTLFDNACYQSHFEILDFIKSYEITQFMINNAINIAIKKSNMALMDWLYQNKFDIVIDQYNFVNICSQNNVDILNWLKVHNKNLFVKYAIEKSIEFRSLKIIKWYHDNHYITNYTNIYLSALKNVDIDLLEWLTENHNQDNHYLLNIRPDIIIDTVKLACQKNNVDILDWMHRNNIDITIREYNIVDICIYENIGILIWLKENNKTFSISRLIEKAILFEKMKIVNWIDDNYQLNCDNI